MPAKRTRKAPDAQADLIGHVRAHQQAYAWTEKAIALRQAGKASAADAAERKAKRYLHEVMSIEARHPPMTRERQAVKLKS